MRGIDQLHGPTFHSICGDLIIYELPLKKLVIFLNIKDFLKKIDKPVNSQNEKQPINSLQS